MKRLDCVSLVNKTNVVDYKLPVTPKTEFIVDDSCFQPMSEAIKSLSKVPQLTSDEVSMYYDFANGRDTGKKVPFERSADFKDITELSNSIIEDTKKVADELEKQSTKAQRMKKFESALNSSSNSSAPSSTGE